METISGNYSEETKPLFRLLRTEAFRFILVCFNHYSLQRELKADLQKRFPNRPFAEVDAAKTTYWELADAYYSLGDGIFLINNFEAVLADPEKYNGLNLHRDKLAQYPVALICFISPGAQALSARDIMEKMPDLWSFRSFMLDLKMDVAVISPVDYSNDVLRQENRISTLGGYSADEKRLELKRLQDQLTQTAEENIALQEILLRQIKDIQRDLGYYKEAIETIDILLKRYVKEIDETALLYAQKGDLLVLLGNLQDAINIFFISLQLFLQTGNKNNVGIACERLGSVYISLGDLSQALIYYERHNQLSKELYQADPNDARSKNSLAISYSRLGNIQSYFGNLLLALDYYKLSNQLENELYKTYPNDIEFKNGLAVSYLKIGGIYFSLGDLQQSLVYYKQSNQLENELYQTYPNNSDFKNGLAVSYQYLGRTQFSLGNVSQAILLYGKSNELGEELCAMYPENVKFKNTLAVSYQYLGSTQSFLNNPQQALFFYEKYSRLEKQLYETYPDNVEFKNGVAISYAKIGDVHFSLNNLQEALNYYEEYNKLENELYKSYPDNVEFKNGLAISYSKLSEVYISLNDRSQALECHERYNQLENELYQTYPNNVEFKNGLAISLTKLGFLYLEKQSEATKALYYFREAEKLWAELVELSSEHVEFRNYLTQIREDITDTETRMKEPSNTNTLAAS